jgi:CBS domain-containing protein
VIVQANPLVAYPDEPLRVVVYRMAETGLTRLPVATSDGSGKLLGIVSLRDLLQARMRNLEAEQRREHMLSV